MSQRILLIDNYDSFTYNLFHALHTLNGRAPEVKRNDELDMKMLLVYDAIVLTPGPGLPHEAGWSMLSSVPGWIVAE